MDHVDEEEANRTLDNVDNGEPESSHDQAPERSARHDFASDARANKPKNKSVKWSLGILADNEEDQVPGSILLLSKDADHNAPLGLHSSSGTRSSTSVQSVVSSSSRSRAMFSRRASSSQFKKKTDDGKIILEPQPDDSMNDPLNWSTLRRDAALVSLGIYCMIGGGMTTVLAAGFTDISEAYDVSISQVALTTGLYMMGLGVGSVIASPTAIAFGKRPVYLVASILFLATALWCAASPTYVSLVVARVVQGLAVSPVECLPSATIAEIFFLHERAYRLGIYTLLLLGGKNLVPLASAAIIQSLGWRWVFWVLAMVLGFCFLLLFFLVPETFWDRAPVPPRGRRMPSFTGSVSRLRGTTSRSPHPSQSRRRRESTERKTGTTDGFRPVKESKNAKERQYSGNGRSIVDPAGLEDAYERRRNSGEMTSVTSQPTLAQNLAQENEKPDSPESMAPNLQPISPQSPMLDSVKEEDQALATPTSADPEAQSPILLRSESATLPAPETGPMRYTTYYKHREGKTYLEQLKPYNGRLTDDNWFRVALRPFVLFAYPSILWSAMVYSLSVGWLIVLSESVSLVYANPATYDFDAIGIGLIYISPFIGGILGTVVAGKLSDYVVRYVSKLNGGIYEPEFRLIMIIPVALATVVGLMGFGWSVEDQDSFWVPTIFFGFIGFGCTMGSTTAITFAVDSYRQFAGEALVTINFSKNIFHGMVFSLFVDSWLESDGPKTVFVAIGSMQLFFLLFTIPMYIFGKRARMWTTRKNFMRRF